MTKLKKVVIVGSGETGLIAYEYFTHDSIYEVAAFSVHEAFMSNSKLNGVPVVATETLGETHPPEEYEVYVAVSSGKLNRDRTKLYQEIKKMGYTCASYISSRAFVWKNVRIGENCFIFENNTIQPFVTIGNNVTLWSGNHVGHNTTIRDNVFVSSHCVISGYCKIGENCFLGVNCTIENNTTIGVDNFIGAGVLIQKNTGDRGFYQHKQTELSKVDSHRLFKIKEES